MRRMSFGLTQPQFQDGSKDVTRRMGWKTLKAGTRLRAVNKSMGLRPGESAITFGVIRVLDVRREALDLITADDVRREGFPDWTPAEFVAFFCKSMKCKPSDPVTRIEFCRTDTDEAIALHMPALEADHRVSLVEPCATGPGWDVFLSLTGFRCLEDAGLSEAGTHFWAPSLLAAREQVAKLRTL